jgi:NAD(P)-dependent dehydrogenase (short-subunit alcohol dehydrogenase family)
MSDTILITGANRGIGLELTRIFASNGWRVIACCRQPGRANDLKEIADSSKEVRIYALDVNDNKSINRLSEGLHEEPIDILLNNAGIFGPKEQPFGDTDAEVWLQVMRTNVVAPLKMAEAFIEQVTASQRKIIASIGSMMGSLADNTSGGYYVYRTSKAAVHMVMKSLSVDLQSRGVTAVVFHPGWVRTDMGGPQAPTSPKESAAGLFRVLTELKEKDNGSFLTFDGKQLPW